MSAVNLGLIGLGEWPREAYVPILKELPEANVVAVAARTEGTQQFAREQFGDGIATYASYQELLADDCIQAVMVALPNELHAQGIEAAVASGKHVFFEPPIGHAVEETGRILAGMFASEGVIQCDLEVRCLPVMDFIREQLAAGTIGDALMAKVRLWANWGYGGGNWNQHPEVEGFFPWLGCWYLDLLDCVFEITPLQATVAAGYAMNGSVMDHGWTTLTYPDGRLGEFELSLVAIDGLSVTMSVLGTKGELEAELTDGRCRWRSESGDWQHATHDCSRPMHGFVGMRESIIDFLAAIQNGQRPRADVNVTQRVHEAMLACAQSEAEKQAVAVQTLGEG